MRQFVGPAPAELQALRRKHDRIDSGFVPLVFHILNWAAENLLSKSSLWIHGCLRAP